MLTRGFTMPSLRRIMEVWESGNSLVITLKSKDAQELEIQAGDHVEVQISKVENKQDVKP